MAIKINLKKRKAHGSITISAPDLTDILNREEAADLLVKQLKGMIDNSTIHDKNWLLQIVNWVPQGGHPLSESAKWFKLAKRVADLDEEKEGSFTLSDYQVNLIWARLISPEYKVVGLPQAFLEFIMELQQASGRHFPEEEPDEETS